MTKNCWFEAARSKIPSELLAVSGKVFYSGRDAFDKPAAVYVLGANPGGDPVKDSEETISEHTNRVANEKPANWSEYRDESWEGREAGTYRMQPRVLHMFEALELDPRQVPASNLVFQRSRRESSLPRFKDLAQMCWPFHQYILDTLTPKVIVCLGKSAGAYVRDKVSAHKQISVFTEHNRRRWQSASFASPRRTIVVVVTHPSVADWRNLATDPTELVVSALRSV